MASLDDLRPTLLKDQLWVLLRHVGLVVVVAKAFLLLLLAI